MLKISGASVTGGRSMLVVLCLALGTVIGELLGGIIGFIPNCAASVVLTTLYLEGAMSGGAMLSGLLVGSGVGLLVLLRMNRDWRDNLVTLGLLYAGGVIFGLLADVLHIV